MADLSDVENAIVTQVTGVLYPAGISQASAIGVACRVYRGWPSPSSLDSDLADGTLNVTIFPADTPDEVPDAYLNEPHFDISPVGLTATVVGEVITISGAVAANQIVGLLIDGEPFSYSVRGSDTTASIAANLSALIGANRIAVLSGSTFTIPGASFISARTITNASVSWGVRRQRREVQIICWCPSPTIRDSACKVVDIALASSPFLDLSDGTRAHARYVSTQVYDQSQNALLYRRDLLYRYEFTTKSSTIVPVMLFGDLLTNGGNSFV